MAENQNKHEYEFVFFLGEDVNLSVFARTLAKMKTKLEKTLKHTEDARFQYALLDGNNVDMASVPKGGF